MPLVLSSGFVSWSWAGVLCALFFLCGGTVAWILGYHIGFAEGKRADREERDDVRQYRV